MDDAQTLMAKAKAAGERGDKAGARFLLDELVFNEARNDQDSLLLAEVVKHENGRADCSEQALAINPENVAARRKYSEMLGPRANPKTDYNKNLSKNQESRFFEYVQQSCTYSKKRTPPIFSDRYYVNFRQVKGDIKDA